MGLRLSSDEDEDEDEEFGMDLSQHEESAYDFESVLGGARAALTANSGASTRSKEVNS